MLTTTHCTANRIRCGMSKLSACSAGHNRQHTQCGRGTHSTHNVVTAGNTVSQILPLQRTENGQIHQPARSPSKHTHSFTLPDLLVVPRGEEEETLSHLSTECTHHTHKRGRRILTMPPQWPLYVHTMQQQTHSDTPQPHHKPSVLRRNQERESTPSERGTTTQMAERGHKTKQSTEREHIAMAMGMVPPDTNVAEHTETRTKQKWFKKQNTHRHMYAVSVCVV